MSVTIKRKTGFMGMASKIQIKVNGEKAGTVSELDQVSIEIPKDKASIKVTQFGIKSNEITVKDGDILEVKLAKLYRFSIPLFMIMTVLIIFFIPGLIYKLIAYIVLSVLYTMSMYLPNGFCLKKVTEEINS